MHFPQFVQAALSTTIFPAAPRETQCTGQRSITAHFTQLRHLLRSCSGTLWP